MAKLAITTWDATSGMGGGDRGGGRPGGRPGGRAPLAVLVHGVTSSATTWWQVGPALAGRGWDVVAPDLRGHGSSPRGTPGMGLADLAADVAETIRAEYGERPVELLVGHSLGALTAMTLLAAEPGFARLLVLEDPPCQEVADWSLEADRIAREAQLARAEPDVLRAELLNAPGDLDERDAEQKLESLLALDVETLQTVMRTGMVFDVAAMARGLDLPTLLFLGEPDRGSLLVGPARAATATALQRGWTEVVPCGHSVHREAFDSFMRRLDAWLERVGHPQPE
jgi:pimeloyl-ACP methyl ester carboxylesterase